MAFPTNDGYACIGLEWNHERFDTFRADVTGNFMKTLDLVPGLAERVRDVRDGKQEERIVGTGDLPNFFRKPYGPGWALVGNAI